MVFGCKLNGWQLNLILFLIDIGFFVIAFFFFVQKPWFQKAYYIFIIIVLFITISSMLFLLYQIHYGKYTLRQYSIHPPSVTYACCILLGCVVIFGFCMHLPAYNFSLYGCDVDPENTPSNFLFILNNALHFFVGLFVFIAIIYITQRFFYKINMLPHLRYRAHYICEDTMADFVYIMVAIVLGFLFLRALIYKGKFIIEQQCKRMSLVWQPHSFIYDNFCPDVLSRFTVRDYVCNEALLREEQHFFYMLQNGLLRSIFTTCTVELMPVMMGLHWYTSGKSIIDLHSASTPSIFYKYSSLYQTIKSSGKWICISLYKIILASGKTMGIMFLKIRNNILNIHSKHLLPLLTKNSNNYCSTINEQQSIHNDQQQHKQKSLNENDKKEKIPNSEDVVLMWLIRPFALALIPISILLYEVLYCNYMSGTFNAQYYQNLSFSSLPAVDSDPNSNLICFETFPSDFEDFLFLIIIWLNLLMFILLYFCFTKELHLATDEFFCDYYVLLWTMLLSIILGLCTFYLQWRSINEICIGKLTINLFPIILMLCDIPFLIGRLIEFQILQKIMLLDTKTHLYKDRRLIPSVSIAGMLFNMVMFGVMYFYIDVQKHKFMDFIEYFSAYSFSIMWLELSRCAYHICLNMFFFSSMLCWIEVLMRFHEKKFFIFGYQEKAKTTEVTQNVEQHQSAIDQTTSPTSSNNLNQQSYEAI